METTKIDVTEIYDVLGLMLTKYSEGLCRASFDSPDSYYNLGAIDALSAISKSLVGVTSQGKTPKE